MSFIVRYVLAVLQICCLFPLHAHAFETMIEESTSDVFSLGEIEVSGSLDTVESTGVVREITREEMQKSSARTVDEAITLMSNVNVRTGGEGVPRVDIRGFRTRHVLFLLDGIPINSALDQQFDPSIIPVENVSRIKVIAGANSVLYGQGGLGGVINIITKKGTKGFSSMLGIESGDGTPYYARGSVSGGVGKFTYLVSGSAYQRDNFPLASDFTASAEEQSGYRTNSDNTRYNGYVSLGYSPTNDLTFGLTFNYAQGAYGKPSSAIDNKFDPYAPPERYARIDAYHTWSLQLSTDWQVTKAFSVRGSWYYNFVSQHDNQYDDETYTTFDDPFVPNSYKLVNRAATSGVSLQPRYDFGTKGSVTLGLTGQWDSWDAEGMVKPGGDDHAQGGFGVGGGSPPYYLYPVSDNKSLSIYSAAIQYEVSPLEKLNLVAGYAYHWQLRDERNDSGYSIYLGLAYDILKKTRINGAYQRNIRFPSISQLYKRDSNNYELVPEIAHHYQLGVEQKLSRKTVLGANGFLSYVKNFIALDQTMNPQHYKNFSEFRFYGFETSAETRLIDGLSLKADYTYLISDDRSGGGKDELQYIPKDKLTFSARYDFDFGLTPYVSVVYVANSYVYTKTKAPVASKAKMKDYTVVNAKLNQKLMKGKVTLYVGVDNLFNEDYEQSYGIPRPGRYIFGGAEYRF